MHCTYNKLYLSDDHLVRRVGIVRCERQPDGSVLIETTGGDDIRVHHAVRAAEVLAWYRTPRPVPPALSIAPTLGLDR